MIKRKKLDSYPRAHTVIGLAVLMLLIVGLSRSQAQNITGTITGTVTDPTGGVVPNAQLTVRNVNTGLSRVTVSNGAGLYSFPFLPVGVYQITCQAATFKKLVSTPITLQVDQTARFDVKLEIGAQNQTVTVTGGAPLINTETAEVGEVIATERVQNLPLNGRQFLQLALLNSDSSVTSGSFDAQLQLSGPRIIMNGQQQQYNNYTVDGTNATDVFYNTLAFSPSIDSIQEFKVLTNNYSAEYGGFTGAQVNISTKSGTNQFHGTAYEFFRNSVLDAKNFFDSATEPIPPFKQNQFGATLGGPIFKGKTFFFGGYEGLRIRKAITTLYSLPDTAERNGNLSEMGYPTPIPPSTFNPAATALLAILPVPPSGNAFLSTRSESNNGDQYNIRIDYQLASRNSLFGRFTYDNVYLLTPGLVNFFDSTTTSYTRNLAVGDTQIINDHLVNEFRFGFNRTSGGQGIPSPDPTFNATAGIQGAGTDPRFIGIPVFSISAFGSFGPINLTKARVDNTYEAVDNISYTRGKHQLKFGGLYERFQFNPFSDAYTRGSFTFNGAYTGNSYADFLKGVPFLGFLGRGDVTLNGRSYALAGYGQDDWNISSRLTLNLGVRYEYEAPVTDTNGLISTLDLTHPGGPVFVAPNTDPANFVPGLVLPLPLISAKEAGLPTSLVKPSRKNFSPRVGFEWSLGGNKKTVLRGGYGIYYAFPSFNWPAQEKFNMPWLDLNATLNPANVYTTQTINLAPPLGNTSAFPVDPNFRIGYTNQWQLGIEQSLAANMMFSVQYNGNNGIHLMRVTNPNQPALPVKGVPSPKPIPQLGNFSFNQSLNNSNYNALQVHFEKRNTSGLNLVAQYTFSKCLDYQSSINGSPNDQGNPQNSHDLGAEYGPCAYDLTHHFSGSVLYQLPFGRGRSYLSGASGIVNKAISGWQLVSIITAQDGEPFGIQDGVDQSGTGQNSDRPNVVPGVNPNAVPGGTNYQHYFNAAAFVLQPKGTFGNSSRNLLRGPGLTDVDFSAIKTTSITERASIEFRSEMFNLFNHPNFGFPVRTMNAVNYTQILSANDGREIQFALKVIF